MYIYIYIYIYIHTYIHIHIYIYILFHLVWAKTSHCPSTQRSVYYMSLIVLLLLIIMIIIQIQILLILLIVLLLINGFATHTFMFVVLLFDICCYGLNRNGLVRDGLREFQVVSWPQEGDRSSPPLSLGNVTIIIITSLYIIYTCIYIYIYIYHYTPDLATITVRWRMSLSIRWNMPLKIHGHLRGVVFRRATFCPWHPRLAAADSSHRLLPTIQQT